MEQIVHGHKTRNESVENGTDNKIETLRAPAKDLKHLLLFSAYSIDSLKAQFDTFCEFAERSKHGLCDLGYTLAHRREKKSYRAYAIATQFSPIQLSSMEFVKSPTPRIVFVFTGQGAQWTRMGASLIDTNSTFRETIRQLDKFLLTLPDPPKWNIEGE